MENEITEQLAEACENESCWCRDGDNAAGFYWGNTTDGWHGPFKSYAEAEENMKEARK
jgi:hypothetical protein